MASVLGESGTPKRALITGITDWQSKVDVDADLIRPADIDVMVGDATKAATVLGERTTKTFDQIVAAMVETDLGREQPS